MMNIRQAKRLRRGMTLVEIIIAMAILSIVVVLIMPVMGNAFNMIALNGDRQENEKGLVGNIENALAGEDVTESLVDVSVDLPGGVSVDGKIYRLTDGSGGKYVDIFGFLINPMAIIDPTGTVPTSTGSTDPTATTSPSTTAAEIDLSSLSVDVSKWGVPDPLNGNAIHYTGTINNTATGLLYQIRSLDGLTVVKNWTPCTSGITTMNLSSNTSGYQILIQQIGWPGNDKIFRIRPAPIVVFHRVTGSSTSFYLYTPSTGTWHEIVYADAVELILTPGDTWTRVVTGKRVKKIDTSFVYARLAVTLNGDGVTVYDPASFPAQITSFGP